MSFRNTQSYLILLLTVAATLISSSAWAWVEYHYTSHEARITLGRNGNAHIEQVLGLRVRGGPLRTLDITIADQRVTALGEVTVLKKLGKMQAMLPVPAAMEQRPDGSLRIDLNDRQGVRTGKYELRFSYDADLLAEQRISRDGSMLSVTWVQPKWGVGIDNDKVVFVVPTSSGAPMAGTSREDTIGGDDDARNIPIPPPYLATLVRLPAVDELTLLRPHVSKDEQVAWTIRVSANALADVHDPSLTVTNTTIRSTTPSIPAEHRTMYLAAGAVLAFLVSLLLTWKHHEVARASKATGSTVSPLIPVGIAVRVALAGPLLAVSVAAQMLLATPHLGTAGVLLVTLLLVYRTPKQTVKPRGPGKWLALTVKDVRALAQKRPRGFLDLSTRGGKVVFAFMALAYGAGVAWVGHSHAYYAYLMALDSLVLFALFGTGRWNEQPVDQVGRTAPWALRLLGGIRKNKALEGARVSIIGRFPKGSKQADELRVRIIPKGSVRGLKSIEVGLGWAHGQGGALAIPEVLLRALEGSECHRTVTVSMGSPKWLRGRNIYEKVLVLQPTLPTVDFTVRKVAEVARMTTQGTPKSSATPKTSKATARRVELRSGRLRTATAGNSPS